MTEHIEGPAPWVNEIGADTGARRVLRSRINP